MGLNVNRWLQYAKAKLDASVASSNDELDRLEAKQEADRADRPWLGAEGDAPTLAEARDRIQWESGQAERMAATKAAVEGSAEGASDAPASPSSPPSDAPTSARPAADPKDAPVDPAPGAPTTPTTPATPAAPGPAATLGPFDPIDAEEAAARDSARIELEQRARESADRLEQIRKELGVDPPAPSA